MTVKIRLARESDVIELIVATFEDELVGVSQLTTDRSRPEALDFYEKLGFLPSHYGLKLRFQSLSAQ